MAKDFLDELMEEGKRRNPQFPKMVERAIAKRKREKALLACRRSLLEDQLRAIETSGHPDERKLYALFALCEGKALTTFLTAELRRAIAGTPAVPKPRVQRIDSAVEQLIRSRDARKLERCANALDASGPGGIQLAGALYDIFEIQRGWANGGHQLPRAVAAALWLCGASDERFEWQANRTRYRRETKILNGSDQAMAARHEVARRRLASGPLRKARLGTWRAFFRRLEEFLPVE